jgi:GTP-binding protein
MFYDHARIYVAGGDGGNGVVAFRREKYVPRGGPSGGDGGNGGNIILEADPGLRTLVDLKYKQHYRAARGEHGQGKNMHGRNAPDLVLRVPVGTVVRNEENEMLLADLVVPGQRVIIARGGQGGRGNARFSTARYQTPRFAEKGEPGETLVVQLELKLLADVGLIGYPNVGKSTLIAHISAARPKIADYPFTTLIPNLGVVQAGEEGKSFVVADIPGLIAGAHAGTGLGHEFLRHVERTRLLVHVLDLSGDFLEHFYTVTRELALYNPELAEKVQLVAANKMDLPEAANNWPLLQSKLGNQYELFPISAATGAGLDQLIFRIAALLDTLVVPVPAAIPEPVVAAPRPGFTVKHESGVYVVSGQEVERLCAMTDLDNPEAVLRLQRIFKKMGVDDRLRAEGVQEGDLVRIGKAEFEFYSR